DRVKFLPKVPVRDLHKYTKNAYLGFQVLNNVCFNHYSASSNKLFEYMMSGIPVVACSFPEIQRVVEEEQVGVCVDSHDAMSIAAGVNRLLDDVALRNEMATNAYKARHTYNWSNEKEFLLDIYKEVV
ncbi:MAG: glycosyltransferase, partial [Bacillaceae bacterium]